MRFLKWNEPKNPWATRLTATATKMLAEVSEAQKKSQSDWLEEVIRKAYEDYATVDGKPKDNALDLDHTDTLDKDFLTMLASDIDPKIANRLEQGITHVELSKITGIDRTSVNRFALGKRNVPAKVSDHWFYHAGAGRWFPKQ